MTFPSVSLATDRFTAVPASDLPRRQCGAYALVRDENGRILTVQANNDRCYLPGGRIEPGESAPEALAREIAEECGWHAEICDPICDGEQFIFGGTVRLAATYWRAQLSRPTETSAEHALVWLTPGEAASRLHRAADRQALSVALV